ncbi:unnamed protein product [Echinostoma caproni]|uniref:Reverse transcriptase domain-containing protein n=1 Tax=Echinostoma caproni TaxID=27848 RepID=A0A183A0X1_9TREM|nr:unnamed protein product [Echinostoma caproni]
METRPLWWSRLLAKLLSRKRAAWKRFTATNGHSRYLQYLKERKTYDRAQSNSNKRYELTLAQKRKTRRKAYYGYVQSKAATREAIGSIHDTGGNPTLTCLKKASALQQHYEASYTVDLGNALPDHSITTECPKDKLLSEPQEVEKNIEALDKNKSAGPDDIRPAISKPLKSIVARPVANLFTKSLETAILPRDWKAAIDNPIYKG